MKHVRISLALVIVLASAAAQTSAPGVCFSFNTTGAPNATLPLVRRGRPEPRSHGAGLGDDRADRRLRQLVHHAGHGGPGVPVDRGPRSGRCSEAGTSLPPNANGVSALVLAVPGAGRRGIDRRPASDHRAKLGLRQRRPGAADADSLPPQLRSEPDPRIVPAVQCDRADGDPRDVAPVSRDGVRADSLRHGHADRRGVRKRAHVHTPLHVDARSARARDGSSDLRERILRPGAESDPPLLGRGTGATAGARPRPRLRLPRATWIRPPSCLSSAFRGRRSRTTPPSGFRSTRRSQASRCRRRRLVFCVCRRPHAGRRHPDLERAPAVRWVT